MTFRFSKMPFRRKLLAFAAGISLLSLVVACSWIAYFNISANKKSLIKNTSAEADILAKTAASAIVFYDQAFASKVLSGLEAQPDVIAACIYTQDGEQFAQYTHGKSSISFPEKPQTHTHNFTKTHLDVFRPIKHDGETVGTIFIRVDTSGFSEQKRSYLLIVAAAMGVSLLAAGLFSFVLQRIITRPVMELADTARDFSVNGNYDARAQIYSDDEFGEFTSTFNQMLALIQARDAELRDSEERNRSLLENLDLGVALIDKDFNIVMANPEYCSRAGKDKDVILGRKCFRVMHGKDAPCQECPGRETLKTGQDTEIIMERTNPAGEPIYLRLRSFPLFDENRHVNGFICLSEDITRKRLEEKEKEQLRSQLIQSQKMEAVGRLAGGMAHDFNNMLAIILGNASLGQMVTDAGSQLNESFASIVRASDRAKDLTMKLLTFSRKEQINVQDIWMHDAIEELVEMLSRTIDKSIDIKTVTIDKCLVHIDKNQILQALLNVCVNAGDAMPSGGTLTIEVQRHTFDGSVCRDCGKKSRGDFCCVQISDTGIGMSREVKQKIMEPFFTTKGVGKGTGLGLSVTHGIIEGHKGHIHVYSEISRGTCVKIYLPLSSAAKIAQKEEEERRLHRGTESILVVDDEPDVLHIASQMLTHAGYKAFTALGGDEALEIVNKHNGRIDLVVLDLIMPGISGSDVFYVLKEKTPGIKVLLASGFSINGQAAELLQNGVRGFVQKPFDAFILTKAIRNALDQ